MANKRISQLTNTITAFRTGDVIPVDGPSGTAKMSKDSLLQETAQNTIAENVANEFDENKVGGYSKDDIVTYNGRTYRFNEAHTGEWTGTDVIRMKIAPYLTDFLSVNTGNFEYVDLSDQSLWEQGGINFNTGETNTNTDYLRTQGFFRFVKKLTYTNKNSAVLTLFCYDNDGNFISWTASAGLDNKIEDLIRNNPKIAKFKIAINCNTSVTPSDLDTYETFGTNYSLTESRLTAVQGLASKNSLEIDNVRKSGDSLFFDGRGTTYSFGRFTNFQEGCTYIIYMPSDWSVDDPNTNHFKLSIAAYADEDTIITRFVQVLIGGEVQPYYTIKIPAGTKFISFGGRAEIGTTIKSASVNITPIQNDDLFARKERMVISAESLENQSVASGIPQHNSRTNRVLTNDIVVFPTPKFKFIYKAPEDLWVYFVAYTAKGDFGQYIYSTTGIYNGEERDIDVSSSAYYGYRLMFGRRGDADLSADEVKTFIRNGDIELIMEYDAPQYADNYQLTRGLAVKKLLIGSQPWFSENPTFVHVSDLHGDAVRLKNSLRIAESVGADAVFNSGDSVMYNHGCGSKFVDELSSLSAIPMLFCIGNHESYPTGQSGLFTDNIAGLVTHNGYLKASGTPADDCYWYRDFDSKKIRVIAINYYNNGVYNGCLGQAQLDWFVGVLASTPADYGVIVELHSPEDKVLSVTGSDKFYQKHRVVSFQEDGFYIGNRPIMQIIDGFISKSAGTESYTDNGTPVSVSYDFTGVASGVEFIAYIVGHRHEDWIGKYAHSTNLQISLGVTTGNAICSSNYYYGFSNQSDLPRNQGKGTMQDAVNVYGIDRDKGIIKVARIGSDITELMDMRDVMTIAYR
jgi:hypothetical protein